MTSRDEKNVTSYVDGGSVFPKRLDAKVMAHYVFFMFGLMLTLTFILSRSLFLCGVNIDPLVSLQNIEHFLRLISCDMTVP